MTTQNKPSPEASLNTIHSTMNQAQTALFMAGTASILLMWGALTAIGYLADFAIASIAPDFADDYPWFRAPLWGVLVIIGIAASAIIGSRAAENLADPDTVRRAGIKVFAFWVTVAFATWTVPGLSGLWTVADPGPHIAGVAIGIVSLGYILFGLFTRIAISILGLGIAAAYYLPAYFAGDDAYAITAVLILILIATGALWLRKSGVQ